MRFDHRTLPQRVRFGTGQAAEAIAAEVEERGARSVMMIASPSDRERAGGIADSIAVALWWNDVVPHVPIERAERPREAARAAGNLCGLRGHQCLGSDHPGAKDDRRRRRGAPGGHRVRLRPHDEPAGETLGGVGAERHRSLRRFDVGAQFRPAEPLARRRGDQGAGRSDTPHRASSRRRGGEGTDAVWSLRLGCRVRLGWLSPFITRSATFSAERTDSRMRRRTPPSCPRCSRSMSVRAPRRRRGSHVLSAPRVRRRASRRSTGPSPPCGRSVRWATGSRPSRRASP